MVAVIESPCKYVISYVAIKYLQFQKVVDQSPSVLLTDAFLVTSQGYPMGKGTCTRDMMRITL